MTTNKLKHEPDNKEQSRRFEETARELGADESGKSFHKAMIAVSKKKTVKKKSESKR